MTNRSGAIGTRTETAVVRVLQQWWPNAERRRLRGRNDAGDITGTPGICWSVKGGDAARSASDDQVSKWLLQAERQRENAHADIAVLVLPRKGIGVANAGYWWAVAWLSDVTRFSYNPTDVCTYEILVRLHLRDICYLLAATGYGDSPKGLDEDAARALAADLLEWANRPKVYPRRPGGAA